MGVFGRLKKKATVTSIDQLDQTTSGSAGTPRSSRGSALSRVFTPRSFKSKKHFDFGVPLSFTLSPVSADENVTSRHDAAAEDAASSSVVHHGVSSASAMSSSSRAIEARTFAAGVTSTPPESPKSGDKTVWDRPERKRTMRAVAAFLTRKDPAAQGDLSDHWLIEYNDLVFGKTIGHSSFGTVHEGTFNGTKVAVKTLYFDSTPNSPNSLATFRKEAELNCKLRHPHIVLFMGICLQPNKVCLVTELMSKGNVRELLVRQVNGELAKLDWALRQQWALDTARGMAYLHSLDPPMIHRDLKTTNLLVDRGMSVKICDFGLSCFRSDKMMAAVGTVHFAAPEVLKNEVYTEKADLFSFGTVMWELFTRRCVFEGLAQIDVFKAVLEGQMPEVDESCDERYRNLMKACWSLNAQQRPSFRHVIDNLSALVDEMDGNAI